MLYLEKNNLCTEEFCKMIKVKMNVQTAYHGNLLRAGKVYEIDEAIAKRWIASNIAEKAEKN